MNVILDAVKRKRAGLVLGAAMVATGCAEKADEPFVDPEFMVLLSITTPPPCDCGEYVERFGRPIMFDSDAEVWRDKSGSEVDLRERAETEFPDFYGFTHVHMDPDATLEETANALASLGAAGICKFDRNEAEGVFKDTVSRPIEFAEYGDEIRIVAFRDPSGTMMMCREGEAPARAKRGYSRQSAFCANPSYPSGDADPEQPPTPQEPVGEKLWCI